MVSQVLFFSFSIAKIPTSYNVLLLRNMVVKLKAKHNKPLIYKVNPTIVASLTFPLTGRQATPSGAVSVLLWCLDVIASLRDIYKFQGKHNDMNGVITALIHSGV